ncbi:LmeA family phospholipid-binding protein [Puerhibacterium puerhi]|uniref:LmeA family phospholipid-binding protein n=1 Tax=Puerhibacterium puerhi TaxID=2692623 RepID=UPI00135ADA06|nr:DUF2993 domain-containing protein [Puerhibacterium puerhi]
MSRPRRGWVRALVTLLVLAALLVAADRAAAWFAGNAAAQALETRGEGVTGADVSVHGFPFLTQLAAGSLDDVTGTMRSGTFGTYELRDVRFATSDLEPRAPYHASAAQADGVLTYASVQAALADQVGADVSVGAAEPAEDGAGALEVTFPATVLGATVDVGATAVPTVTDESTVTLDVRSVTVAGARLDPDDLPGGLGDRVRQIAVPLDLPAGVALRSVAAEPEGLRIALAAQDVDLASLAAEG